MTITERLDTITAQLEKVLSILGEEAKASEDYATNGSLIKSGRTANSDKLREWAKNCGAEQVVFFRDNETQNKYRFVAELNLEHCPYLDFDSWDVELEPGEKYSVEELCGDGLHEETEE